VIVDEDDMIVVMLMRMRKSSTIWRRRGMLRMVIAYVDGDDEQLAFDVGLHAAGLVMRMRFR